LYDIGLLAILSGAIEKHGKHRLLYDINNQTGGGYVEVCKVAIGAKGVLRRYDDWGRPWGVVGGFDIVHVEDASNVLLGVSFPSTDRCNNYLRHW
jgi:hypothetical protein